MASYSEIINEVTKTVKLFGDWDKSSSEMIDLIQIRTKDMEYAIYKDIRFVDNDTYDYAVCFNYPIEIMNCPEENVIGLILEPPEILDAMYPNRPRDKVPGIGRMYSFCHGTEFPAYPGLGFATVSPVADISWPPFTKHHAMMICSNKVITPWHQKRQTIFEALLRTDLNIDFYGRGMDNADERCKGQIGAYGKKAILEKYSLCIDFENSPHGAITDKYFDPILSNTIPVSNAKELYNVAPNDSFFMTDWDLSVEEIVHQIRAILEVSDDDILDKSYGVDKAKQSLLGGSMNLTHWIWERLNECES